MSQMLAMSYDAVPYPGLPVARSQPDFLEVVARLRGLQPAPAAEARVLELGCGIGQNLLPLAERYPQAKFLGVDVSSRQIQIAQETTRALGVANVTFHQQDLLDLNPAIDKFDYIIAHGVYSWVDEPHRERLLTLCRDMLAPHGVAYVSYKVHPGWRLQNTLRDLMRYDARLATTAPEVVKGARLALDFLQKCFVGEGDYDQLVREQLAPLLSLNDAFLWHDYLSPISHPVLYRDFMRQAKQSGLQLLGEASLGIRPADQLDAESEQQLAALTTDPVLQEQLRDVLRNRTLRQTLLCQAGVQLAPTFESERLAGMYLSARLSPEGRHNLKSGETEHFTVDGGGRVGTPLPLAKAALAHLGEVWPASISTEGLLEAARQRLREANLPEPSQGDLLRLRDNLVQCAAGRIIALQCGPDTFVAKVSERPQASPLARWQAPRAEVITNRRHEAVHFDPFARYILSLLDGTRTQAALINAAVEGVGEGRLVVLDPETNQPATEDSRPVLEAAVRETLERLAQHAVLIA